MVLFCVSRCVGFMKGEGRVIGCDRYGVFLWESKWGMAVGV